MKYCDDCQFFKKHTETKKGIFTCEKGHVMEFKPPKDDDFYSLNWGFYKRECKDRQIIVDK